MKKLLTLLMSVSLFTGIVNAGELTWTVIEKKQTPELKEDGAALYTISYYSSASQRKLPGSWLNEEPREGTPIGLQYRGPIDRTIPLPENFAQVNDVIRFSNNIPYITKLEVVKSGTVKKSLSQRSKKQGKQ